MTADGAAVAGRTVSVPAPRPGEPASGRPLRASVVICAYTDRRWSQLVRAVASVGSQTVRAHEVVVVVDHNHDLFLRARAELPVRVVESTGPPGLSGARNTGVDLATGDVVAFLDDDAHAEPDWLEHLLAGYVDEDVVAVGGAVLAAFDTPRPAFLPEEFDWVVGCSYRGLPTQAAAVRNVIGANMSFRRGVFDQVGGFEVSLGRLGDVPLGCEETELCLRATRRRPGARVMLAPAARVHHQVPDSRVTWGYFRSRCYAEGLSKAAVSRLAGRGPGLASERHYATRTLPSGVLTAVREAVVRGRPSALARAAAIVAGLAVTSVGYAVGTYRLRGTPAPAADHRSGPQSREVPEWPGRRLTDEVTVVVPVRNAESLVDACLTSVLACRPAAVVVVDGLSTDRTRDLLARYPVLVLSDGGQGLPAARLLGAKAARTRWVALVDVDVVLPDPDALERLVREHRSGGYTALQAGLRSVSGDGYWGRALVHHHRTGRSQSWFGLVCTVFERHSLLEFGFDPRFVSGEDIELRWRLRSAGALVGVSTRTVVEHRFAGDDFAFAKDQFLMDGRGLGRMVRTQRGWRGLALLALPAAAAVRGVALAVLHGQPRFVPYYLSYATYNYLGMVRSR